MIDAKIPETFDAGTPDGWFDYVETYYNPMELCRVWKFRRGDRWVSWCDRAGDMEDPDLRQRAYRIAKHTLDEELIGEL
jgi:hypothetical protein